MSGRRRSRTSRELTTIYWRDIPAQVTTSLGRESEKLLLTPRFQNAIDRSAAVAGMTAVDDYVTQWRREVVRIDGELLAEATAEADRIEGAYPRDRLESLVRQGGKEIEFEGS